MKSYSELTREELLELKSELEKKYEEAKAEGLALDMSRGKPSPAQLDLSREMLDVLNSSSELKAENGIDVRNYGLLEGIYEARKLMGDIMGVPAENVIVCGNASLNIMYDLVSRAEVFGFDGCTPWAKLDKVKFLCPAPGYDRHFGITELFGIEMITVPMNEDGPDMDIVEKYVNNDESVKGIWCVPKYSNPQGVVYSDETVKRFAALKPAAKDFRVFWDNAYAVHDLYPEKEVKLLNIFDECKKNGNENMVFELCSTSKISFSGAGISAVASSKNNIEEIKKYMKKQTIGYDKINQLRHVKYFKDINGIKEHMKKHAALLRPKFEAVLDTLENDLAGTGVGTWTKPLGGYFISFEGLEGTAKAIVQKCKDAGMTLTGAGATYPYKNDPKDSNIRIAPSYPSLEEMSKAAALFTICVRLVSIDKILETK